MDTPVSCKKNICIARLRCHATLTLEMGRHSKSKSIPCHERLSVHVGKHYVICWAAWADRRGKPLSFWIWKICWCTRGIFHKTELCWLWSTFVNKPDGPLMIFTSMSSFLNILGNPLLYLLINDLDCGCIILALMWKN